MTFRLAALALLLLCAASAQSLDLAAGLGGVKSGTASDITGVFLSVSGTAMVKPNFGANADLAWSSPEISFGGPSGTRPLLFSLNFVARDPLPNFAPEVQFGYGLERVGGMCSNCVSGPGFSTISPIHRSGVHFGLADTAYVAHRVFARFEYHLYLGSGMAHPNRFTLSVGYTFGHRA